jgi:hypothetical protein
MSTTLMAIGGYLAAPAPDVAPPKGAPPTGLTISFGAGMVTIAFAAQYLLKKRLKNPRVARIFMWIAWVAATIGGEAMSREVGNTAGITSAGAAVVSIVMLFFLAVDVADKRPDWPAFFITVTVPIFMRLTGGGLGTLFADALSPVRAVGTALAGLLGM